MVTLEQVKLLESKVGKAIDFVGKVTEENTQLQAKLDSCQKRIDELEGTVNRFKEDQGRIENGIISALNRLNQFEDIIERGLREKLKKDVPVKTEAGPALKQETPLKQDEPEKDPEEPDEPPAEKNAAPPAENGELDIF
jgi:predicted nuclease with TOPRIM domain